MTSTTVKTEDSPAELQQPEAGAAGRAVVPVTGSRDFVPSRTPREPGGRIAR